MEILIKKYRLTAMSSVTILSDKNSAEADALMFEKAGQWFRENPDAILVTVAFRYDFEPTKSCLELFVEE